MLTGRESCSYLLVQKTARYTRAVAVVPSHSYTVCAFSLSATYGDLGKCVPNALRSLFRHASITPLSAVTGLGRVTASLPARFLLVLAGASLRKFPTELFTATTIVLLLANHNIILRLSAAVAPEAVATLSGSFSAQSCHFIDLHRLGLRAVFTPRHSPLKSKEHRRSGRPQPELLYVFTDRFRE